MTAQDKCQVVGDDMLVTNPKRCKQAIERKVVNALLLKVNPGLSPEPYTRINPHPPEERFLPHLSCHLTPLTPPRTPQGEPDRDDFRVHRGGWNVQEGRVGCHDQPQVGRD